ncbi:hypothetical protein D3C71_1630460 [compost metagenome]
MTFCAVRASASLISCWRATFWSPAAFHSWPKVAAMAASVSVQADRRSWSLAARADCSSACDWSSVRSSDAECASNAAAAVVKAC